MESATSFYIEIQNPRLRLNIIMAEESPAGCMFCNCLHVVLRVSDPSAHARFSNVVPKIESPLPLDSIES